MVVVLKVEGEDKKDRDDKDEDNNKDDDNNKDNEDFNSLFIFYISVFFRCIKVSNKFSELWMEVP